MPDVSQSKFDYTDKDRVTPKCLYRKLHASPLGDKKTGDWEIRGLLDAVSNLPISYLRPNTDIILGQIFDDCICEVTMINNTFLPVKIVLANDGSNHANAAINLLTHIDWPPKSTTHLLTVIPSQKGKVAQSVEDQPDRLTVAARADWPEAQARLHKIARILRTNGHLTQTEVHHDLRLRSSCSRSSNFRLIWWLWALKGWDTERPRLGQSPDALFTRPMPPC